MKESWVRKNIKNIGVGVLATVGSLVMSDKVEAQTIKDKDTRNQTEQMAKDSMKELVEKLLNEGKIISLGGNMSNVYDCNIGKYEIEFYDANKDKKFGEGAMERVTIQYKNDDGMMFSVEKGISGFNATALSLNKHPGFKKIKLGQSGYILVGHPNDETVYIRDLSDLEIKKVFDDINIIQLQEKLQN
ncbi:MAG: hypothetical protein WCX46_03560 [Candidatus Paceibacterota bacterium]